MQRLPEKLLGPVLLIALGGLLGFLLFTGPISSPTGFVTHLSGQESILAEDDSGIASNTLGDNYDMLVDELFSNPNVITTINDNLWVPWFSSSTQCQLSDLKSGGSCNSGETIDFQNNCMVTDEFSQVGILVAMGKEQERMDQFYNTLDDIESSFGNIPAWRVYRDGNDIQPCRSGINGNCDTASDATARIISALYIASDNIYFTDANKKVDYDQLADTLSQQMVDHETRYDCKPSSLGFGDICYWLAAGSQAQNGGLASTDFGYTGYYADAIIAMLQACGQTGDMTFCSVASNYTLNYLEAAKWDGSSFSTPPGRSFKWGNLDGIPQAQCTNGCSPDKWDDADAPRAFGMCQALYYADLIGHTLPGLEQYCQQWGDEHGQDATAIPTQYFPDGSAGVSPQSSYFAQGLQSLFYMGYDQSKFQTSLLDALDHYSTTTNTWDWTSCFGIYTTAFPMRALGHGLGRDFASFVPLGEIEEPAPQEPQEVSDISFSATSPASPIVRAEPNSQTFTVTLDNPDDIETSITWFVDGTNQTSAYNQNSFTFTGGYDKQGSYNVTARVTSSQNNLSKLFVLVVLDIEEPQVQENESVENVSNESEQNDSIDLTVSLQVAQWYPQDLDVVWECVAQGGSGNYEYDYIFGDGTEQLDVIADDTYYIYAQAGTYEATCIVTDTSTLDSAVAQQSVTLSDGSQQNSSSNTTEETSTQTTQQPQTQNPSTSSGGGGGGGAFIPPSENTWPDEAETQVEEQPLPSQNVDPIMIAIAQYFSGEKQDPITLVRDLFDYFEEEEQ